MAHTVGHVAGLQLNLCPAKATAIGLHSKKTTNTFVTNYSSNRSISASNATSDPDKTSFLRSPLAPTCELVSVNKHSKSGTGHSTRRPLSVNAVAEAPVVTDSRPASVIRKIQTSLKTREKSAVQVTEEYLERIDATEPHVKSFLHVARERALEQAAAVDRALAEGQDASSLGLLVGVPLATKDNLCTHDMPSTAGSRILEGYRPPYDATAVAKLRSAGAVLVGKTNMDEFGMGSSTENSAFQAVPDFLSKIQPLEALSNRPLEGLRFGLVKETVGAGVDAEVVAAIQLAAAHLESLGATVSEVSLPSFSMGLPAYYILAPSEASSNLARYDGVRYGKRVEGAAELVGMYKGTRMAGFGPEVKRRILTGTYALSAGYYDAFYKRAQQVRTLIQRDFGKALKSFDALVNVNLAGLPAVVLPCGMASGGPHGLPVGLQIIGPAFGEVELLQYAHVYEQTTPTWTHALPTIVS
eukprot:jgi/Mesen1/7410/ME000388S06631